MLGRLLTSLAVFCSLFGLTSHAKAQLPPVSLSTPSIAAQNYVGQGNIVHYQIKGATSASGFPAGTQSVDVSFKFYTRQNANFPWVLDIQTGVTTAPVNGAVSVDTGYLGFNPSQGFDYRVVVSGQYTTPGGNPVVNIMAPKESAVIVTRP